MTETTEIDRKYLIALETIVCHYLDDRYNQNPDDVERARRIVDNANLRRPRE